MKKLLITTLIALVIPAAASAHDGWHHHHHALLAKLSGTLASSSGTLTSFKLGNGTYTASVAATGAATTRTGEHGTVSCAPATATLTLVGTSTTTATLAGKSCTWTATGSTTSTSAFFGRNADTHTKAFLVQKSDGSVNGAVFAGFDRHMFMQFAAMKHRDCDGDH